jgi:hypothetical protein
MRKKFLVRGEPDESMIRKILDPILLGIGRATHKASYRTRKGVVEYVSLPSGSTLVRYGDTGVSGTLRKILLWNRDSVDELEQLLRSNGIDMVEIVKDGPTTLELKR